MPHLMNCEHDENGWCLACVRALHEEKEGYKTRVQTLEAQLARENGNKMKDAQEWTEEIWHIPKDGCQIQLHDEIIPDFIRRVQGDARKGLLAELRDYYILFGENWSEALASVRGNVKAGKEKHICDMVAQLEEAKQLQAHTVANVKFTQEIADKRRLELEALRAGLEKVRVAATLHYMGQAYDPAHMRAIANVCIALLNGEEEPKDLDEAPLPSITVENLALKGALERSIVCIDDWINTFAPEFCDEQRVKEAKERLGAHGTLAYLAEVQEQNRAALGYPENDGLLKTLEAQLGKLVEDVDNQIPIPLRAYLKISIGNLYQLIGVSNPWRKRG